MKKEICHMIWIGDSNNLPNIYGKGVKSFIENNFDVNLWSYDNLTIDGATSRNLNDIVDISKINSSYYSNELNLTTNLFKNIFVCDIARILIIKEFGGWYFDFDIFNLKNQTYYKKLRSGKTNVFVKNALRETVNGVFFLEKEYANLIFNGFDRDYFYGLQDNFDWAEFGPRLFTELSNKHHFNYEKTETFLPIDYADIDLLTKKYMIKNAIRKVRNSYQIHLYGSTFAKHKNIEQSSLIDQIVNKNVIKLSDFRIDSDTPCSNNDLNKKTCGIIITAYKTSEFIMSCINSLNNQRLPKGWSIKFYIGVDDCKETSNTLKDNKIEHYYSKSNVGTYVLSNSLLMKAKEDDCDVFLRFDSDDVAERNFLYNGINNAISHHFVMTYHIQCDENLNLINGNSIHRHDGSVFMDKEALENLGGYAPYRVACDTDLRERAEILGYLCDQDKIEDKSIFKYRRHPSSLTKNQSTKIGSGYRDDICNKLRSSIGKGILKIENPVTCELIVIEIN